MARAAREFARYVTIVAAQIYAARQAVRARCPMRMLAAVLMMRCCYAATCACAAAFIDSHTMMLLRHAGAAADMLMPLLIC